MVSKTFTMCPISHRFIGPAEFTATLQRVMDDGTRVPSWARFRTL